MRLIGLLVAAIAALVAAYTAGVVHERLWWNDPKRNRPDVEATCAEHDGTTWKYVAPPEWVTTTSPRWDN